MDLSGNYISTEEYDAKVLEREDLITPHACTADFLDPEVGAELDQLDSYADEFHKLVETMFEALPTETRILEGTQIPTYAELRAEAENENKLSETSDKEDNGECSTNVDS